MNLRTLRASEREPLFDLLDGWEVADGWRGRDFFRRYVELDGRFEDENVWVAAEAGRLVACVQIFPREVRVRGAEVRLGGIGAVFTRTEARGAGVASALLARAGKAMQARSMELSLLFAGPTPLYARFGWRSWGVRAVYRRDASAPCPPPGAAIEAFDARRDLPAVAALHAAYSGGLDGTVVRDGEAWQTSLRLAGNPAEEFVVARRGGEIRAYARAAMLYGYLVVLEFGRAADASDLLADLLVGLMAEREPDPLAPDGKSSGEFRRLATGCHVNDPALTRALEARGVRVTSMQDPGAMLRCLDPRALVRRVGMPAESADASGDLLREVLPPERFSFWPADRF